MGYGIYPVPIVARLENISEIRTDKNVQTENVAKKTTVLKKPYTFTPVQ